MEKLKQIYRQVSEVLICNDNKKNLNNSKNMFQGKTCAIIGNAPSLKVSDLNILKENSIFSFATNGFYKIYEKTEFRPDCYVLSDAQWLRTNWNEKHVMESKYRLFGFQWNYIIYRKLLHFFKNDSNTFFYYKHLELKGDGITPTINGNLDKGFVSGGYTTLFEVFQIARYMGFNKIILLGVECNYSQENSHFYKDDSKLDPAAFGNTMANKCQAIAFSQIAECFHDVDIINCSTNTKLSCFKISDLKSVFCGEKNA